MKTRKREIAKAGIFGSVENPVIVTEKDLLEMAETFPEVQKAPIVLGHTPDPKSPRLGNVVSVSYDSQNKSLSAEIEEDDTLYDSVEKGFYPDVSIGAKTRAQDGKRTLRHLAYLGEEPPAIKDLKKSVTEPLGISAAENEPVAYYPSPSSKRLYLSDTDPKEIYMDDDSKKTGSGTTADPSKATPSQTEDQGQKIASLEAENKKLRDQLASIAKKYPDEAIELSDGENPHVTLLMKKLRSGKKSELIESAKGKLNEISMTALSSLADTLSLSDTIELSDGEDKKSVSQFDALKTVLSSIEKPVEEGAFNLSDGSDNGGSKKPFSTRYLIDNF